MPRILHLIFVVAVLGAAFLPPAALANGIGRIWAQDIPAGPYLVTFSSQPVITPGSARVTVQARLATTGTAVDNANVQVWLTPPSQDARQGPYTATLIPIPPAHYDAIVQTDVAGEWTAAIEVDGPAGQGTATTPVTVSQSQTDLYVILAIVSGLVLLALLGLVYRKLSNAPPASEEAR